MIQLFRDLVDLPEDRRFSIGQEVSITHKKVCRLRLCPPIRSFVLSMDKPVKPDFAAARSINLNNGHLRKHDFDRFGRLKTRSKGLKVAFPWVLCRIFGANTGYAEYDRPTTTYFGLHKKTGWQGPLLLLIAAFIVVFRQNALESIQQSAVTNAIDQLAIIFFVLGVALSVVPVFRSWLTDQDVRSIRSGATAAIIGGTLGAILSYGWPSEFYDGVVTIDHAPRLLRVAVVLAYFLVVGPVIAVFSARARGIMDSSRRGRLSSFVLCVAIAGAIVSILVAFTAPNIEDPGIRFGADNNSDDSFFFFSIGSISF